MAIHYERNTNNLKQCNALVRNRMSHPPILVASPDIEKLQVTHMCIILPQLSVTDVTLVWVISTQLFVNR